MVRFSPSAALGEGPYGEGGPEEAQGGPGRAQDRGQRGGAQGEGAKGDPEGEPKEEIPERAQGGVEPRAQWAQCYLRLPDNCCGHCFVLLLSCFFLAAVMGFFSCCHWLLRPLGPGPKSTGHRGPGAQERTQRRKGKAQGGNRAQEGPRGAQELFVSG